MLERTVLLAEEDFERRCIVPVFGQAIPGGFLAPPLPRCRPDHRC